MFETMPVARVTIKNLTITGGTGDPFIDGGSGGGINNQGNLTVINSTISGNSAGTAGRGIYNSWVLTMINSTICGNSAPSGGGIYDHTGVTVTGTTISGNSAVNAGGGVFDDNGLAVTNSTITGNCDSSGNGGGIYSDLGSCPCAPLTVTNTTISENSASQGGGIANSGGTMALANTVLAGNTARTAPDCAGTLSDGQGSHSNNLIGIGDGCGLSNGSNGDQVGSVVGLLNPSLGPLAANGGRTLTMRPQVGSLLTSAGYGPTCTSTGPAGVRNKDQRGHFRNAAAPPVGRGVCDIGAYDTQGRG